jgi:O-antigen ligase/tetratricopeptide (TPR) repeat protein
MEGYITILHLAIYFIVVANIMKTKEEWFIYFNIFMLTGLLVCLYALLAPPPTIETQHTILYGRRIYGTLGNPPFLASYLLLLCFMGIMLLTAQKKRLKYGYVTLIIFYIYVIYLTATRGAIMSLGAGFIMFGIFIIHKKNKILSEKIIKRKINLVLVLVLILIVASTIVIEMDVIKQDTTIRRFTRVFSDHSVLTRIEAWKMALNAIKEKPILGWGQENFIGVYTVNAIPYVEPQIWLDRAHNIVLEWLVNAGILGLISYMMIFVMAFVVVRKSLRRDILTRNEFIAIVVAFLIYFMQNLFTFDTINTYIIFFALLAYVESVGNSHFKRETYEKVIPHKNKALILGVAVLSVIIVIPALYILNYKPIKVSQMSYRIAFYGTQHYSNFNELLNDFKGALSNGTFGISDLRQKMLYTSSNIIRLELIDKEGAFEFIKATIKEIENEVERRWYNLQFLSSVIHLYQKIADHQPSFINRAENLILRSIRLNPEYQWLYFALADIYMIKKDYEKVFIIVNNKIANNENNEHLLFKLALASVLTSRDDIALNTLEKIKKIRSIKYNATTPGIKTIFLFDELYLLAQTYSEVGNYQEALSYYKKIIALLPERDRAMSDSEKRDYKFGNWKIWENMPSVKAKVHFETANIYRKLGDTSAAVRAAQKAEEIKPSEFKEKVRSFINSINSS